MRPVAFRIKEFKSIVDTGVCHLSSDGITVLAGENESGKTAILSALRDFNLESGRKPLTDDFIPDDDFNKCPAVSVCFEMNWEETLSSLKEQDLYVLPSVGNKLRETNRLWITRDLTDNKFLIDKELVEFWNKELDEHENFTNEEIESFNQSTPDSELPGEGEVWAHPEEFVTSLYREWPVFVYFSSFDDILQRNVKFSLLKSKASTGDGAPQIVKDYLKMAGVDLAVVEKIADNDKLLKNYLNKCNGQITGDFLSFWNRAGGPSQSIDLRVDYYRDSSGELYFAFYVHDTSSQHPDQRSRGFLWFLSFYLRLASSRASNSSRPYVLLIDEPGSFLHARAQRDVLSLFEQRIVDRDLVIYSTHSPYLIPADRLYRLKVVIKTQKHGTHVADKLSDSELSKVEFSDTLSPILTAIGIDIREQLKLFGKHNIVVEGLADYLYIHAWWRLWPELLPQKTSIFPGTGASTTILLSSLLIGWDLNFIVGLDNDEEGHDARKTLIRDMGIPEWRIIQQKEGGAIEDMISPSDFNQVLASLDAQYRLEPGEKAGKALKRLKISKPIAAKRFAEIFAPGKPGPTKTTQDAASQLLKQFASALTSQV